MAFVIPNAQRFAIFGSSSFTIGYSDSDIVVFVVPAAVTALAITFPTAAFNGQQITIVTSGTATGVTLAGGTFTSSPTTLNVTANVSYFWSATDGKWFRR